MDTRESSRLERTILEYKLPASALMRPRNILFLARSTLTAVGLFLRLPFRNVERMFPCHDGAKRREPDIEMAAISVSLAESLLRSPLFPFGRTCLRRCLLLSHLLRRSGVGVGVAFGVDPRESGWEGHSWLVLDGKPFLESGEDVDSYLPMFVLPRTSTEGSGGE